MLDRTYLSSPSADLTRMNFSFGTAAVTGFETTVADVTAGALTAVPDETVETCVLRFTTAAI